MQELRRFQEQLAIVKAGTVVGRKTKKPADLILNAEVAKSHPSLAESMKPCLEVFSKSMLSESDDGDGDYQSFENGVLSTRNLLNNWDMIYGMRSCIVGDFRSAFVEWVNIAHYRQTKRIGIFVYLGVHFRRAARWGDPSCWACTFRRACGGDRDWVRRGWGPGLGLGWAWALVEVGVVIVRMPGTSTAKMIRMPGTSTARMIQSPDSYCYWLLPGTHIHSKHAKKPQHVNKKNTAS